MGFDITQPQPFVIPVLAHLSQVLENLSNTMALRKGSLDSVQKLIDPKELCTVILITGLQVSGKIITGTRNLQGKILLITFENYVVTIKEEIIFKSKGKSYSMAVGQEVTSCFNGPANKTSFNLITHQLSETIKKSSTSSRLERLETLCQRVRNWREYADRTVSRKKVFFELKEKDPLDWLLRVELYELVKWDDNAVCCGELKEYLEGINRENRKVGGLIDYGLEPIDW